MLNVLVGRNAGVAAAARLALARLALDDGDAEEAVSQLQALLRAYPDRAERVPATYLLALAEQRRGETRAAIDRLQEYLRLSDLLAPYAHWQLAEWYGALGDTERDVAETRRAASPRARGASASRAWSASPRRPPLLVTWPARRLVGTRLRRWPDRQLPCRGAVAAGQPGAPPGRSGVRHGALPHDRRGIPGQRARGQCPRRAERPRSGCPDQLLPGRGSCASITANSPALSAASKRS